MKTGVTLIEMAIVLVIIGLIVGGILVGQDMINAAGLRATAAQYEKFNSAVNAFKGKYGGIPGDLGATQSASFGLYAIAVSAGQLGRQDDNGLIQGYQADNSTANGETLVFWRHLSEANLVDGVFGTLGNGALTTAAQPTALVTEITQSLPPAKMGRGNFFAVYSPATGSGAGLNYYEINAIRQITTIGGYVTDASSQMAPIEAYNLDLKIDDGMPNTGNVIARGRQVVAGGLNQLPGWQQNPPSTGFCINGPSQTDSTDTYALADPTPSCALRLRFN